MYKKLLERFIKYEGVDENMAIHFEKTLKEALKRIGNSKHKGFLIYNGEEIRTFLNSDKLVGRYGEVKWEIVRLLNKTYNSSFDLHNWIDGNEDDVAHFLNEVGSNCLNYSSYKIPFKFHLWLGKKGFVLGIEQKGKGFNAEDVYNLRLKENKGAAFNFFRKCKSEIFFDDSKEARVVLMEFLR